MGLGAASPAGATDPLLVFLPEPPPGEPSPTPPPNGYLNGPCGLAVDSAGRLYVADHYHGTVSVFSSELDYSTQLVGVQGPCGLALDAAGGLYLNRYHRGVAKFSPAPAFAAGPVLDTNRPTGVAVDLAADQVYVNERTHVAVYDSSGDPLMDGPEPLRIGLGSIGEGYGLATSDFPATAGRLYVPDAADNTVKIYDPATDPVDPVATIVGPPGGFTSLRDSSAAVDRVSGDVYVVDNLQPDFAEQPRALVHVFDSSGVHQGHLKHSVVHGIPTGLAVDNSAGATQGRVYVTSGNTHHGGLYAYPPDAATHSAPFPPTIPPAPLGSGIASPSSAIGGPASVPGEIACEGDACQHLPAEPLDPTLTTLLRGLGNPKVRYRRAARNCRPAVRAARRLSRLSGRLNRRAKRLGGRTAKAGQARRLRARAMRLRKRSRISARAAQRCVRANRSIAGASASSAAAPGSAVADVAQAGSTGPSAPSGGQSGSGAASNAASLGLLPGASGFAAGVRGDRAVGTLAGSHPYQVDFTLGLDQGGGGADLRALRIELPPGLLANPAAPNRCSATAFATPRSSPLGPGSSGESCPDRSQVGTVELRSDGETRRFGLFNLDPPPGAALRLGASPGGEPLLFDARIHAGGGETHGLTLEVSDVSPGLQVHGLGLVLWGVPWDASHNGERGNCLNEVEPTFPWAKCSVGEPLANRPLAFLTLPTECPGSLSFRARATSWQQAEVVSAEALGRDSEGDPALLSGCASLGFDPQAVSLLANDKASSSSGFVFRFGNEDSGLAHPRARIRSHVRRVTVELPSGVTLNPSLGAGLVGCAPAQLAAESAFNPPGAGCPNGAKIGDFRVRSPYYEGFLRGAVYLATPHRNPFGSLIAVYLVGKSAQRGFLIKAAGKIVPDPRDGTLTATFEDLPQLPYTDFEVSLRTGQRAPLVTPPRCGPATTRAGMTPWGGTGSVTRTTDSEVKSGIDAGPCPTGGAPPFAPGVVAGGVNSNVGFYTPYFVRISRRDTEQELTSYSLVLPKGIVGKLAGIPFCGEAEIAAARARSGFAEIAAPSCPAASQVGRTDTGYGVGPALTYAPGRIYLAGPYRGAPLSLVTINAATVGPFDLGTVVIRSAFTVDPHTAQLRIDSRASDPIPHILAGVPLRLREVRVHIDRPQFTRNPTSCEASELISTLTGSGARFDDPTDDPTVTAAASFQLLNCLELGFRPRLGLQLRGAVRRGGYPGLRAVFRARGGDASLKRIAVTMPKSLFLAQNHIRTICTRGQFAAERCPRGSIYGHAVAHTPLFDEPLRGPVVLRSSDHRLPDLVALLRWGEIRIVLQGRIGPSKGGGIRAFFDGVPDAPVDRFVMSLFGGNRGLLVNSVNVCNAPPQASVKALGQNNRGAIFTTKLRGECKKPRQRERQRSTQRGSG